MFRPRSPQRSLLESQFLVPPAKAKRLHKSWAEVFQQRALPLIHEESFAPLYCEDNGRPNQPVQVVFGVLLLKEIFNLTDEEALEQLEFNLLWQHALGLSGDDSHLCQKTLHNFRTRLLTHDMVRLVFEDTTDRIIAAMGVCVDRQRLDSTHIVSNITLLTRLGLFCETLRVLLATLRREHPRLYKRVPDGLRRRYLKDDGAATSYGDVRRDGARRRLSVCARDLYRLHELFAGTAAAALPEYRLVKRLLAEQCEITAATATPGADDDDVDDGGAPVVLKEPKDVASSSLQTPHDPDVTYSGHKGKGYEVQIAETCDQNNAVEFITYVAVTDSCGSDARATMPALETLWERELQPTSLVADTAYGSAENAVSAECLGTELISPTSGSRAQEEGDLTDERRALTTADFNLDVGLQRATVCPAGHASITYIELSFAPDRVAVVFDQDRCEACPHYKRCPAQLDDSAGGYVLTVNLVTDNLARRRRREASGEFAKRYAIRAGIEATNSELKRKHGLGKLPVRGRLRVVLAVCLKALACNLKRMVRAIRMAAAAGVPTGGQDGDLLAQRKPRLRRSGVTTRIFGGLTSSWLWPRYFGLGGGIAVVTVKRG
jgi:hypothetical protein